MKSLPVGARIFLILTYGLGLLGVLYAILWEGDSYNGSDAIEIGLFVLMGILAGSKKVVLLKVKGKEDIGSMSLSFAIIFAAMIRFNTPVAVLVGITSTLSSCLYPKAFPLHQTLFNLAVNVFQTVCACEVMRQLNNGVFALLGLESLPAIVFSGLTFFCINTGCVATVITLAQGKRLWSMMQFWQETFLWTAPSYFLGAAVSSLAVHLLGKHIVVTLACVTVIAYFTHVSYSRYMERADALLDSKERLADLYLATIRSLALAIDAKDQYTHQHILRVQQYAVAIAKRMGISGDELVGLETAALLHDIGKLGVPEYVLLKPGRLTDEEFAKIKEHPRIGADILDPVPFPWPVLPGVKHHHEKWDGTGYPDRLKGEDIPLQGRILAVADVYDALTSTRSYRNAWTHEKAVAEIRDKAGSHFDPHIVEAFLEVIDGVVDEMATQGIGPKAPKAEPVSLGAALPEKTRAEVAARDIQRAASELWALYEVAQTLSSSLGLKETLDILARKLAAILPSTGCMFLLRSEFAPGKNMFNGNGGRDGGRDSEAALRSLEVRAAVGVNYEFFFESRTNSPESLSVRVARERQSYSGPFDAEDMAPITPTSTGSNQTPLFVPFNTALIIPIVHQGEVLGTINLYHPQADAFSQHDRQLLEMVAERAALAIYNGLLFDRTVSQSMTDPLTGLANIRYITQQLEMRCNDPEKTPFTLICLDLDSFKPINDNFGHQKGDQVLKDLGVILRSVMRIEDVVARYGGDEFLIIAEGTDPIQAMAIAQRLQDAVANYDPGLLHCRVGNLRLGASVGTACFPGDGEDTATLLSVADRCMYQDKADRKLFRMSGDSSTFGIATREGRGRRPNSSKERRSDQELSDLLLPTLLPALPDGMRASDTLKDTSALGREIRPAAIAPKAHMEVAVL